MLNSSVPKFYDCHHEQVDRYEISISQHGNESFSISIKWFLSFITDNTLTGFDNMSKTTGV
jgi:hypothetical protein